MSVGLGNIWRFPFTAYQNGGGAFLIPYLIVLIFIGRPLYFLEMCLGQFCSTGSVNIWNIVPIMKGFSLCTRIALQTCLMIVGKITICIFQRIIEIYL